jgi:murein DD-endopeptidase MepM/ murein hydrolase activator NlpD
VIILKHSDGKYSLYGHLDCIDKEIVERFLRKNGKTPFVSSGERLGIMGNSYKTPESEGGYHARRYCRPDRLPPEYESCSKAITAGLCTRCDSNGFRPHLHFEMKSLGKLGNPLGYSGSQTDSYFGYTPYHPDYYGYFNPFPPAITNINPTSGVAGNPVTINGANFGGTKGTSTVRFGTTIARVTSWNDTKIIAIAPAGSGTVNVTVTTSATQSNGVPFTYTPTAPTVIYFKINNDAASTTSRTVTLNNTATGNPTQYIASESSTFSGATWQTYSTAPSFTLSPGNGTKTVYFKVRNSAGVESPVVSDSIILDTTAPTNVQVTAPTSGQTVSGTFTFKATAQDNLGTVQKMEFYVDSDTTPACTDSTAKPSGSTFQCNWNTASKPNGPHTVRAKAYDPSGNFAFSSSVSFTINNSTTPTNRLLNPSFESGSAYWVQYSSTGYNIITNSTAARARTGSWYAWFGAANNVSEYIYQDVTIPANATVANVEFWYQVATDETNTSTCYDKLVVEVRRPSDNALLRTLTMLCNYHKTNIWTRSGPFSVLDFRGQTIRLRFYCTTDGSLPTSFFVDDVALMADGN